MDIHPSFFLFAISAAFTPGPNNIMIMASGLNFGVRASMPHFFGICLGFPVMFLAVGFGLGYLFGQYPLLHIVIKLFGIFYLLYLAWIIANSASADVSGAKTEPLTFLQAMLFQWVNPKAWIMGTSAIAAYTTVESNVSVQILEMALIFFFVTFPSVAIWMIFGVGLQHLLKKATYLRAFNITMAILLVVSIWPIVAEMAEGLIAR